MADGQQGKRQSQTGSTASATPSRDIRSDDARASVEAIAALQVEAQARINGNQHANQIGSQP